MDIDKQSDSSLLHLVRIFLSLITHFHFCDNLWRSFRLYLPLLFVFWWLYCHLCLTGCLITSPGSSHVTTAQLILSGGEGYINFRIGGFNCLNLSSHVGSVPYDMLINGVIRAGFLKHLTSLANFAGDDASDDSTEVSQAATPQRSERSHMIIWQNPPPSVPSPALWYHSAPDSLLVGWHKADIYNCRWEMMLSGNGLNQHLNVAAIKASSKSTWPLIFCSWLPHFFLHLSFDWIIMMDDDAFPCAFI